MNRSIIKPNNPIKNIAAKTSSKFNIFRASTIKKPNPDCAPIISPETKNIQLVPTAICIPAMICLNAPGNNILRYNDHPVKFKFAAIFKYWGSMSLTPLMVLNTIGKKAAIKIIAIAGKLPIPNHRTTNGAQAIGDIGLIN